MIAEIPAFLRVSGALVFVRREIDLARAAITVPPALIGASAATVAPATPPQSIDVESGSIATPADDLPSVPSVGDASTRQPAPAPTSTRRAPRARYTAPEPVVATPGNTARVQRYRREMARFDAPAAPATDTIAEEVIGAGPGATVTIRRMRVGRLELATIDVVGTPRFGAGVARRLGHALRELYEALAADEVARGRRPAPQGQGGAR